MNEAHDDPVLPDLLAFLAASPTPMHAVESAATRLLAAGAKELAESDDWSALTPGAYFVKHAGTCLFGFYLPEKIDSFRLVGAHTDSPNLRLKSKPEYTKEGYLQLGVEVYGGILPNSWLDRDLSLAGRVYVRQGGRAVPRLVRIDRPLLRVAQLAVHLDREQSERLTLNKQEHLAPILGLAAGDAPALAELFAEELDVDSSEIAGLDLMLYDTVPPCLGGLRREFIFSARLDNQAMCHAATHALCTHLGERQNERTLPLIALFDHEEVGSGSTAGAESAVLPRILERLARAAKLDAEAYARALSRSLCVSADMAHAVHPNYADRHEPRHKPTLNGGPVIKTNAQQRYATTKETALVFEELCRSADVPCQHYIHRTDLPCGSTIGPITSTLLGIRTVDVGNPMLSMHSAREMAGSADPARMVAVLRRFFATSE